MQEKRRRFQFPECEPQDKPAFPMLHLPPFSHRRSQPIELLMRIFPKIKVSVLQLILQSCGNDVVQAIEEVLTKCKSDPTILADTSPWSRPPLIEDMYRDFRTLRPDTYKYVRGTDAFMGSGKSAFTPISPFSKSPFLQTSPSTHIAFAMDSIRNKDSNVPISFFLEPRLNSSTLANLSRDKLNNKNPEDSESLERNNDDSTSSEKEKQNWTLKLYKFTLKPHYQKQTFVLRCFRPLRISERWCFVFIHSHLVNVKWSYL